MMKIKKGDQVIVTTGRDKHKRGKVVQRVDGARVSGDFNATNGVVVAIDSVLLPN